MPPGLGQSLSGQEEREELLATGRGCLGEGLPGKEHVQSPTCESRQEKMEPVPRTKSWKLGEGKQKIGSKV